MKKRVLTVLLAACMSMQIITPLVNAQEKDFFDNSIILLVDSPEVTVGTYINCQLMLKKYKKMTENVRPRCHTLCRNFRIL